MRTPLLAFLVACAPSSLPAPLQEAQVRDVPADGLEVLFCPDDDVVAEELAEIERVVAERQGDPDVYAEGENPWRIRYAVYNLRNDPIVDALAAAEAAGVDVQVLMDADQLDPARDWNTADERLVEAGFTFAADHRELTEEELRTVDLVGIEGAGLMHLKTRLFETPTDSVLITGSMNPGDNAPLNDETWHWIHDAAIVGRYQQAYDDVLHDRDFANTWDEATELNVLFSPEASGPAAATKLLEWLAEEDEQILLMVFSVRDLTAPGVDGSLVDILGERVAAGVPVYLITDRKQSDAYGDPTEDRLRDVGVHVYEATNATTEFTAMHHKVAVLGRTDIRVITDAANWSKSGLGSATDPATNIESTLFVEAGHADGRTGRRYLAQFVRVLSKYADQSLADGERPYAEVEAELFAFEGWPRQQVGFRANEVHTSWGETARVVGEVPELGVWGLEGPGLGLVTWDGLYPTWESEQPIELLVGDAFEWKLVVEQDDGALRWEAGGNRVDLVRPDAFTDAAEQRIEGTWR